MPKLVWLSAIVFVVMTAQAQTDFASGNQTSIPTQEVFSNPEALLNKQFLPSVQSLLTKMSQEAAHFNYSGAFTYQNQSSIALQSFRIDHWIDKGQEHDRLLFLNGPEREIARDGQPIDCKAMGDKILQGGFSGIGKALAKLDDLYQFEIRSQERIAGRVARVLQVIPKDPYRYGYFLSIDEETGLVLKSWLIDENARPLERYQFVAIDVVSDASQIQHGKELAHQHKAIADITPCNPTELSVPEQWRVTWVPNGFAFAGQRSLVNGQTMLMYTDGLTTFSIFIEPTTSFTPEGVGQRGATLAYMSRMALDGTVYRISVVGEIPVAAAAKIAQSIAGQ